MNQRILQVGALIVAALIALFRMTGHPTNIADPLSGPASFTGP
jgi:hypothetical protein